MTTRRHSLLLTLVLAAAGPASAQDTPPTAYPITVRDGLGRTVTVAKRPERIVSLAPAITETLFAVGAGPRVVAVTQTDSYPPEVKNLPTVGGFTPKTLSIEAVLARRPDVVFVTLGVQEPLVDAFAKFGLTVIAHDPATFEATADAIEQVGFVTDCGAKAKAVAGDFRKRVAAVRERAAKRAGGPRPRVLYVLWDDPLLTAGPDTFVGRMVVEAGGVNVFADAKQHYPRVSDEAVVARDADLIVSPDHGNVGLPGRLAGRPGWAALTAVKAGRVRTVSEDLVNRAGPRLVDGLEAVEKLIADVK